MGNQGMTNWKFIAFFAISLMLIAGLFTDVAIARDGSGTASVEWTATTNAGFATAIPLGAANFRGSHTLYGTFGDGTTGADGEPLLGAPLPAGSRENQLRFSYFVDVNMAGGQVEIRLPSGWTIHTAAENILGTDGTADNDLVATGDAYARYSDQLLVEIRERFRIDDTTFTDPGDGLIFGLNRDGKNVTAGDGAVLEGADLEAQTDRASVTGSAVTVNLSNEWRSGGELVVVLRNVETAIPRSLRHTTDAEGGDADTVSGSDGLPYDNYTISVKSKRSGRLDTLDPVLINRDGDDETADDATPKKRAALPVIRVGNILGLVLGQQNADGNATDHDGTTDGIQYHGPDRVARNFTITPGTVYEGETNKTFRVSFTAGGPMYAIGENKVAIEVGIPAELQSGAGLTKDNIGVIARGPVSPGGRLDEDDLDGAITDDDDIDQVEIAADNSSVTINLDRIDIGGTITLTYELESDGPNVDPDTGLITRPTALPGSDPKLSAFTASIQIPPDTDGEDATTVSGGRVLPQAGSGTITMDPETGEAGDDLRKITLTYTAGTPLSNVTLEIDVKGIVVENVDETDETEQLHDDSANDDDYGYVTHSATFTPTQTIGTLSNSGTTIAWGGLTFTRAGQAFVVTIENVRLQDEGASVEFSTRIGPDGTDLNADTAAIALYTLDPSPTLYITDPKDDAVQFTITSALANPAATGGTFARFSAGQELDELTFTFTAEETSIKDGQVRFTLPDGWTPAVAPDRAATQLFDNAGELTISGGGFTRVASAGNPATAVSAGQTVTVEVPELALDASITITLKQSTHATTGIVSPVVVQSDATEANKPEKITGYFWTSGTRGRGYSAGSVDVEITNAPDGYGTATIAPSSVTAGSDDGQITVDYTVPGSMDDGIVRLVIPDHWGNLQGDDPTEANYLEVDVIGRGSATANVADRAVEATLTGVVEGSQVRFTYGGGTVASRNGAEVQPRITTPNAPAAFIIETDGDGDGSFAEVKGLQRTAAQKTADAIANNGKPAKPLGAVYNTDVGMLFVEVTGADDGSGYAEVAIMGTSEGTGMYPDDLDADGDRDRTELVSSMRVHAGDTGTYLLFTYTPTQTIQDGLLKFQPQGEWSDPQNSPGTPGYTEIDGTGSADLGDIEFDDSDGSVTVEIDEIDPDGTIEIHYGVGGTGDGSGAHAPTAVAASSAFSISVKGGDATSNQLKPINTLKGGHIAVRVYSQASGGGNASASVSDNKGDVGAGDADREVTVVYTAAGEISGGSLKLTIPAGWSHPTADNVEITSTGTVDLSSALYGGDYAADPDDPAAVDTLPEDADGVDLLNVGDVTVGGVSLDEGDTVTFVYSAAMVQPTAKDVSFGVAVDGGSGPDEGTMAVTPDPSDATTIAVGDASPGSGIRGIDIPQAVTINSSDNTLTFIYTATGEITDRRLDIRVNVPRGWTEPTADITPTARGSFTVVHKKYTAATDTLAEQTAAAAAVEKIGPFDRQIAARLKHTGSLAAGDQVVFTFESADAPTTVGASTFVMTYGGTEVTAGPALTVIVGSGKPATAVDVTAPATHLVESTTPAAISVELQDEDGNAVPAEADTVVSLSSSSATGSFTVDGTAATSVTIAAGSTTATAAYTDTTVGNAMITASSGTLTAGTATILVTTEQVVVDSVTFTIADSDAIAKTVARDGDTVTVTATGTPGQTAMVTIGTIVTNGPMEESATSLGTYTRSHTLAAGSPEGDHAVSVTIGAASGSAVGMLTVDNTAPTVTASASPDTVANGDAVAISAVVTGDATSVTANVSLLDTAATASVALADADADGTYTGTHTISADNAAANGEQLITVTAIDAAGNSSDAVATITLQNSISFTSTLPQGISLFHVPLDEEGLDTVGDLETKLGDSVNLLITYDGTSWNSRSSDVAITASLGILVSLSAETTVIFEGQAWADTTVTLAAGSNLIGLPVNDARVTNISDIAGLFAAGSVTSVIVSSGGEFQLVAAAGDPADGPVAGDAAYLVMASAAGSATLSGDGWQNGTVGAAPIALAGYRVDNQTPVLDVLGSVVDEITGVSQEGYRVKVKNLSTKASLSNITSEVASGYNMTFVDLSDNYAARVGDVLEISADSPSPLIGVQPVRHIVTVDDVKNGSIQLEELIAYEIPAETELLRNFPNPFNPETWIPYHLSEDADVKLTIYDVNGEMVRDIDVGHQTAAKYDTRAKAIYWDGRNRFGEQVASGIYFYHLDAGDFSGTRKMVILK